MHNTLPQEYDALYGSIDSGTETQVIKGKKIRHGKISGEHGEVYGLTEDQEIVSRSRYFKEILQAQLFVIPSIYRATREERERNTVHVNRLIHNIEAINGHSIQELFELVPEDQLRNARPEERKLLIQNIIKGRMEDIHRKILNLIKNNTGIKTEFALFQNLLNNKKIKLSKQPHQLRRALMNVAHNFFQDFHDKGIKVSVDEFEGIVYIDYSAFQSAFFQIFDNATKYALNESDIEISFSKESDCIAVSIAMISLQIKPEEIPKIVQERFCGEQAKKSGLNGEGIGMFAVYRTLQMINSSIEIEPRPEEASVNKDGLQYEKNIFKIKLPSYRK